MVPLLVKQSTYAFLIRVALSPQKDLIASSAFAFDPQPGQFTVRKVGTVGTVINNNYTLLILIDAGSGGI